MKKRAAVFLSVAVCMVLVLAFALVACNPKDGDGDRTTGGAGDAIFTEGKTAQEIKDAINASSGYVLVSKNVVRYNFETGSLYVVGDSTETMYVDGNNFWAAAKDGEMLCAYDGGVFYELSYDVNGSVMAHKKTSEQAMESYGVSPEEGIAGVVRYLFEFYSSHWLDTLTDKDGKLAFNENGEMVALTEYIAGSGYVTLGGTTLTIGFKSLVDGEEVLTEFTVSQVNNVTFAPSAEVLALKAEAE